MKVSEILLWESPYLIDKDYAPKIVIGSLPSLGGLKRENFQLGSLTKDTVEYHFWLSKTKKHAQITTEGKDDIGQVRQAVVVKLKFDNRAHLPVKNELQVDTIYTNPEFRSQFLAGTLYIVLAKYGYSVVSDFTQYRGGEALWKKLATESEARNCKVLIWDDEIEDWVKNNGEPVQYNAANLTDSDVWKNISQHNEPTTLLVLQKL